MCASTYNNRTQTPNSNGGTNIPTAAKYRVYENHVDDDGNGTKQTLNKHKQ